MHSNLFFSVQHAYGASQNNYWSAMIKDICAALNRAGTQCDIVEAKNNNDFQNFLCVAIRENRKFIATFNFVAPFPEISVCGNKVLMQELFSARSVTIFLDHPVHLTNAIGRFEQSGRRHNYRPTAAPLPVYGIMESGHAEILHDLGVDSKRIFLFPQAGPSPLQVSLQPLPKRPIDLLFHGTISDVMPEEDFLKKHGLQHPSVRETVSQALSDALDGNEDIYISVKSGLSRRGIQNNVPRDAELARLLNLRARAIRRWKLLSTLSDIEVHFCGDVSDRFKAENPKGIYHGPMSFSAVCDLLKQTKVALNDTINLRQAALIRFHYAMAHGCVVATEGNDWIRTNYSDGDDVLVLKGGGTDKAKITALLGDLDYAQSVACAGMAKQVAGHQWDHRLPPFLNALE